MPAILARSSSNRGPMQSDRASGRSPLHPNIDYAPPSVLREPAGGGIVNSGAPPSVHRRGILPFVLDDRGALALGLGRCCRTAGDRHLNRLGALAGVPARLIEDWGVPREWRSIMANEISAVLEFGAPEPGETATMMKDKLRFHTDSWDLFMDLKAAVADIVVIDARSRDA